MCGRPGRGAGAVPPESTSQRPGTRRPLDRGTDRRSSISSSITFGTPPFASSPPQPASKRVLGTAMPPDADASPELVEPRPVSAGTEKRKERRVALVRSMPRSRPVEMLAPHLENPGRRMAGTWLPPMSITPIPRPGTPRRPTARRAPSVARKVDDHSGNGAGLDECPAAHHRRIAERWAQHGLHDPQMCGRRHRQELGEALGGAEDGGLPGVDDGQGGGPFWNSTSADAWTRRVRPGGANPPLVHSRPDNLLDT